MFVCVCVLCGLVVDVIICESVNCSNSNEQECVSHMQYKWNNRSLCAYKQWKDPYTQHKPYIPHTHTFSRLHIHTARIQNENAHVRAKHTCENYTLSRAYIRISERNIRLSIQHNWILYVLYIPYTNIYTHI